MDLGVRRTNILESEQEERGRRKGREGKGENGGDGSVAAEGGFEPGAVVQQKVRKGRGQKQKEAMVEDDGNCACSDARCLALVCLPGPVPAGRGRALQQQCRSGSKLEGRKAARAPSGSKQASPVP